MLGDQPSSACSGRKGPTAIDEIAARKESFEWGAFLQATTAEAPPADNPEEAAPAAPTANGQVLRATCQAVQPLSRMRLQTYIDGWTAVVGLTLWEVNTRAQKEPTGWCVVQQEHPADAAPPATGAVTSEGLAAATQAALRSVRRTRRKCGRSSSLYRCQCRTRCLSCSVVRTEP